MCISKTWKYFSYALMCYISRQSWNNDQYLLSRNYRLCFAMFETSISVSVHSQFVTWRLLSIKVTSQRNVWMTQWISPMNLWIIICSMVCKYFNPSLPNGPVHPYHLEEYISNFRGIWCAFSFLLYLFIEIHVSKQCRTWSDATYWFGSTLFA